MHVRYYASYSVQQSLLHDHESVTVSILNNNYMHQVSFKMLMSVDEMCGNCTNELSHINMSLTELESLPHHCTSDTTCYYLHNIVCGCWKAAWRAKLALILALHMSMKHDMLRITFILCCTARFRQLTSDDESPMNKNSLASSEFCAPNISTRKWTVIRMSMS